MSADRLRQAALEYNYATTALTGGIHQANTQLIGAGKEIVNVTIGVLKEGTNLAVNLFELTNWLDVSGCLMTGARPWLRNRENGLPP